MSRETVLTGITTTGTPHLGNYVGAIRPAIIASRDRHVKSFYFLADYHSLIKCHDPERINRSSMEVAAAWLALGLDTDNAIFYRQTDIPEIPELTWILTCMTAKGLMNRAHAYKAVVAENETAGSRDPDKGVTMGLFSYPILMAADILMFKATHVPVGRDQIQHLRNGQGYRPAVQPSLRRPARPARGGGGRKYSGADRSGRPQNEQELQQYHSAVSA